MKIGYFYSNFSWKLILLRAQHLYLLQCGYNEPLKFLMELCSEKNKYKNRNVELKFLLACICS